MCRAKPTALSASYIEQTTTADFGRMRVSKDIPASFVTSINLVHDDLLITALFELILLILCCVLKIPNAVYKAILLMDQKIFDLMQYYDIFNAVINKLNC